MFVIIKLDVQRSENNIISVKMNFDNALSTLNNHVKNVHDSEKDIIYLEKERISIYQRGVIYGKTLLFCYQIIPHDEINEITENLTICQG